MSKKVPELRFKGFWEEWKPYTLGQIAEGFEYGLNASATSFDGINKYLRITDIDDASRKFKADDITSPDIDVSENKHYLLKKGDILFARTGASVGKSYLYDEKDGIVYFAGFLIRARIKPTFDEYFIFQNTLTKKYNKFIKITSQRSGQPGVNAKEYSTFNIVAPDKKEQQKIGNLFKKLDDTIELQQQLTDRQQQYKKVMLQKMFPQKGKRIPRIRFKGFSGEWEEKRLSDITQRFDNLRVPITASERVKGNTPYYGANGIQDYVDGFTHEGDFILVAEDGANDLKNYPVKFVTGKIWVNNHAHVLSAITKVADNQFLAQAVKNINFEPYLVGGGRAKLNSDVLMKLTLLTPKLGEQQKIGAFFKHIDDTIALHQRKLENYQQLKKALLQRMFV